MKIKESYKFLTQDHYKNIGIILLLTFGVNLLAGLLILGFSKDSGSFIYILNKVTPSLSVVTFIVLIYSMVTFKSSLSIGNQFGRTRLSMLISNTLSMMTVMASIALLAGIASVTFLTKGSMVIGIYKGVVSNGNLFVKEFLWVFTSLFNTYVIGTFISAIWNRVKPLIRLLIFVGIPVFMAMLIPRIFMSIRMGAGEFENIFIKIGKFFGYSSSFNGFGYSNFDINVYQNALSVTLALSLPIILLAYLIARKSTLNDIKNK